MPGSRDSISLSRSWATAPVCTRARTAVLRLRANRPPRPPSFRQGGQLGSSVALPTNRDNSGCTRSEYRRTQPTSPRRHPVVGGYTQHVDGCPPGPCVAAAASSRYGKRLLTDPDDRLGDPLFGEPAADFGKELSSRPGRRRPLVVEVPAIVALPADAAAVASQSLGEQDRAQLVRCADPHPTSV
jgi:hypothetical protein